MPREDLLIHIRTLYDDLGFKQAQANMQGLQATADQTTATLSRQEATFLSTAKAAQESAIVDTILARAKQELATITAQQTAGMLTEAEAQEALLTLRQSTIAALSQYMSAGMAEINVLQATTLSAQELARAQAQLAASTSLETAETEKQTQSLWKLTAQNRLMLPGGGGLFRLYGPALAIAGLTMLIGGLKGATEAAEKEDRALASLSATLRNVTPNYEQVTQAAHDFTLGLAYQSMFTHEELLDGFQRLVALGVPLSQVYDMLTTATDLATARNIGLDNAVEALGRGYAGQTMRLSRLGIVMWDVTGRVKSFEEVQKELNERFGGTAAAQMDTAIGRMHQYEVAMSEVKETLGKVIEKMKESLSLTALQIIAPGTKVLSDDLAVAQARLAQIKATIDDMRLTQQVPLSAFGLLGPEKWAQTPKTYEAILQALTNLVPEQEAYIKQLEQESQRQQDVQNGYIGLTGSIKRYTDSLLAAHNKSQQEISQEYQDYKDLIDMYNSLLEQTSKTGDIKAWQQYRNSAIEAIDDIIEKEEALLKAQEAAGNGINIYVRNYIEQLKEARRQIVEATPYEPQIKLLTTQIDYAKTIGDTKFLVSTREKLLGIYEQEIKDIAQIIASGQATVETYQNLYNVMSKLSGVTSDIRQDALAISQFKLQQVEFGYQMGTVEPERYLHAIDQYIAQLRAQQKGLNQDSEEYMKIEGEIKSALQTRKQVVDSIAEAEANYQIAYAEYQAKATGNQQELLNFYKLYKQELENQLATLIPGTEAWYEKKMQIVSADEKILDLTNDIADAEKKAAEEAAKAAEEAAKAREEEAKRLAEAKREYEQTINAGTQGIDISEERINRLKDELKLLKIMEQYAQTTHGMPWETFIRNPAPVNWSLEEVQAFTRQFKDLVSLQTYMYQVETELAKIEQVRAGQNTKIAEAAEKAAEAEIAYYRTAAANAMEYYQGRDQERWNQAKTDYLNALEREKAYLESIIQSSAQGSEEYWRTLADLNDLEYERLKIMEEQWDAEKGITGELRTQMGLFNLPEFVRFGLPMALAPQINAGTSALYQTNQITITGGYQMTAQEIANAISNNIQTFSQMAGNALRYGP